MVASPDGSHTARIRGSMRTVHSQDLFDVSKGLTLPHPNDDVTLPKGWCHDGQVLETSRGSQGVACESRHGWHAVGLSLFSRSVCAQ
jgi:hypothetical protein